MTPERRQIDVRVCAPDWTLDAAAGEALVRQVLAAAEARLGPLRAGALEVWFAMDADVQALNRRFRQQDKPTNVLSFAAPETFSAGVMAQFGQLVLAGGVCAREARAAGHALDTHVRHLVLHGLLHLQGHDHQNEAEAQRMETLESAIMAVMGLPDPYRPQGERACG